MKSRCRPSGTGMIALQRSASNCAEKPPQGQWIIVTCEIMIACLMYSFKLPVIQAALEVPPERNIDAPLRAASSRGS